MTGWPGIAVRLALLASALWVASGAAAADLAIGKQKAEICQACHGEEGISAMENVPSIGGQSDQYIQYQLVYFRNGQRKNEMMQPQAAHLANDDIRDIGAYVATLPAAPRPATADSDPAFTERGRAITAERHCAACHGDDYAGLKAAPRVAWQREDYLATSLQNFRDGQRPSVGVAAMNEVAVGLSDDDTRAIAHFLAGF